MEESSRFKHLALFSYDRFGMAAIICAVRKTAEIRVLAMTVMFDMLSNMTAIMSRIGPASPTYIARETISSIEIEIYFLRSTKIYV